MKKAKKLISLLLALTMLLSMIPMAVAAETTVNLGRTKLGDASLEKGTPSSFSHLRDMKDGSAAKGAGETGFWQRLPRNTVVGYGTVTPVNYAVPKEGSVTFSNEGVIGDFSFSLEPWAGNEFTTNPPCLQFNYTALAVGSTTVTVKYYYNYGLINIQGGRTWYEETATFTINVNDGDINKPSKPTVSDVKRFRNYVNTTSSSLGAVYMWCDTYDHQAWFDYITEVDDAYTLGDVVANDGSVLSKYTYPWVCVMTLDANKYLDAYNSECSEYGTHYLKDGQAATETATWYWNAALSKWQFRSSEAPIYIDITHTAPTPEVKEFTVTYTDGVDGAAFADQTYTVKEGDATPAFNGTPAREGYVFLGWEPEVAGTVTANATYTAKWEEALTDVTVTANVSNGALLFLGDEIKVTATANTDASLAFNFEKNDAFKQISSSSTSNSKTVWYRVVKIAADYTNINVSVTGTKGNQKPVTGTLTFGVNLRNRIHVTIKNSSRQIISDATHVLLNHRDPEWNPPKDLKYDAAKKEYVMKNPWDLSNQGFASVSFEYGGETYETKVTKDNENIFDVVRAGEKEIYVEYIVVDPICVTVEVNGDEVKNEKFKGNAGEKLNYSTPYWDVMDQIRAEGKMATVQILIDDVAGLEAVFGTNKNVKIVITTIG
mgnify:CR=1 FL=1